MSGHADGWSTTRVSGGPNARTPPGAPRKFGGHVEATKVFVALHGEDGGFDATNGVQALGGEDVTPGGWVSYTTVSQ